MQNYIDYDTQFSCIHYSVSVLNMTFTPYVQLSYNYCGCTVLAYLYFDGLNACCELSTSISHQSHHLQDILINAAYCKKCEKSC
jgi:hypothetical protein